MLVGDPFGCVTGDGQGMAGLVVGPRGGRQGRGRADTQRVVGVAAHQLPQGRAQAGGVAVVVRGQQADEMVVVDRAAHHQAAAVIPGRVLVGVDDPAAVRRRTAQQMDAQALRDEQRRYGTGRHPAGQRRFPGHQGHEHRQAQPGRRLLMPDREIVGLAGTPGHLGQRADMGRQRQRLRCEGRGADDGQHRTRHLPSQRLAPHMDRTGPRSHGGQTSLGQPRQRGPDAGEDVRCEPGGAQLHLARAADQGDLRADLPPQPVEQRPCPVRGVLPAARPQPAQQLIEHLRCRHSSFSPRAHSFPARPRVDPCRR